MRSFVAGAGMRRGLGGSRRAFTLIELLIAMTLTLILVYAIARFFSFVGETVRDGRAQTEMGGQLRAAAARLRQDFQELTVRVGDRIDYGQAMGCLEIWEGIASDSDPNGDRGDGNGDGTIDDIQTFLTNDLGDPNIDLKRDGLMLGDCDDILVMTIRSQGEDFVGRMCQQVPGSSPPQFVYPIIRSNLAEVIWFTTFKDLNLDGLWQMNEPRYLTRRQLLIRPDLTGLTSPGIVNSSPSNPSDFFVHNDISARISAGPAFTPVANSLSDLSQRQNRSVHQNLVTLAQNGLYAPLYVPNTMQLNVGMTASCNLYSLDGQVQFQGEDKMLSNVLALDVRVFDPYAVLRADNTDFDGQQTAPPLTDDDAQGVLSPGDPGYAFAVLNGFPIMGRGAYVDLWYTRAYGVFPVAPQRGIMLSNCNSAYAFAPHARNAAGGAVWDVWSTSYEKDGFAQAPPPYGARPQADWLTNGLDDDGQNGVDDPGEAEMMPPYPSWIGSNGVDDDGQNGIDDSNEQALSVQGGVLTPPPSTLRGIEVRIRMYEPGTRQTRQVTVATDFVAE